MKHRPTSRRIRRRTKSVLRLLDLEHAKTTVLNSLTSSDAQRGYRHAIDEFGWTNYSLATQGAFRDVSDALIAYQKYYEIRVAQENTVQDLSDSVSTSLKRYGGGIATYLEVLDNQRSVFSAQLTLAQDRGNQFQSLVQPYKALGGGWQQ